MNNFKIGDLVVQEPGSYSFIEEDKSYKVSRILDNFFMCLEDVSTPVWIPDFELYKEKPDES